MTELPSRVPWAYHVSRAYFKDMIPIYKTNPNVSFISVSDTVEEMYEMMALCEGKTHAFFLTFPDVSEPGHTISTSDAELLVDFINKNRGKSFLVHCFAGLSRSAAIARFVVSYLGYDQTFTSPIYNKEVYTVLQEAVGEETLRSYYRALDMGHRR